MNFSPKKFLTSIRVPPSVMAQLMGKCAYTALILYRYPLVTPLKRLVMWEQTVLTAASCFSFLDIGGFFTARGGSSKHSFSGSELVQGGFSFFSSGFGAFKFTLELLHTHDVGVRN